MAQAIKFLAVGIALFAGATAVSAQQPRPTCRQCPGTYIPKSELDAYTEKAVRYGITDQQVRSVDIGKSQVGIGMVTRAHLEKGPIRPGSVAEHEQISEVYYIIEGEGTIIVGPDLINPVKRADDEKTVRLQNGPGWNADGIRNPQEHHLKAGDMLVIPAGTGHLFTEVPGDHITYMMVRIDPDKVVPTKSKEQSDADLKAPPEPASPRNQLKGR
jgi:mannose-6-phosphate isomerase-like protein (cupin superfamily)